MTIESPYRRGADDGMMLGLYLTAMFCGALFGGSFGPLALLTLLMMAATPVVLWRLMLRYHRRLGPESGFGMLWLDGTLTVMFGMLIPSALLLVYMKWINPGFVTDQLRLLADSAEAAPQYAEIAQNMLDNNLVPTAAAMAAQFMTTSMLFGVIVSGVLSAGILLGSRLAGAGKNKNQ